MNHAETIAAIPPAGWALLFAALILMAVVLVGLYQILLKKEVRLKHVELLTRKEAKEAQAEARSLEAEKIRYFTGDLISAQFSLSSNLLRRIGTGLDEAGLDERFEQWRAYEDVDFLLNILASGRSFRLADGAYYYLRRDFMSRKWVRSCQVVAASYSFLRWDAMMHLFLSIGLFVVLLGKIH